MATTIYNKQIEAFYRSVGEGDITVVNGASSSTLNKGSVVGYTPKRWSLEQVYDLFWRAGSAIQRAIKDLNWQKVAQQIPNLLEKETIVLTSNAGSLVKNYEFIYEEAYVVKALNGTKFRCRMIPFYNLFDVEVLPSGRRLSPTPDNPKFGLITPKVITVYPLGQAYYSLTIKGLLKVERFVASTNGVDSWNNHLPDLVILLAIALSKSELTEQGLMQFVLRELQTNYGLIKQKPFTNNLNQIEEQK